MTKLGAPEASAIVIMFISILFLTAMTPGLGIFLNTEVLMELQFSVLISCCLIFAARLILS